MPVGSGISLTIYRSTSRSGPSASLEVDRDEPLGAVFRRVAESLEIDAESALSLKTHLMLSTEDGAWYTDGPGRWTTTVGQIAESAKCGSSLVLFVYPMQVCSHGSPGVLGRGYLCGWC